METGNISTHMAYGWRLWLSHVCWLEPHLSLSARIPTNGCSMWPRLPHSMATSVSLDFSHGSSGLQRWMSQLTMQKPLPLLWPHHRKHSVSLPSLHICDKQITSPPIFKERIQLYLVTRCGWHGGRRAHRTEDIAVAVFGKYSLSYQSPPPPSSWYSIYRMDHSAIHMLRPLCFCTYRSLWLEHLFLPAKPYYHLFIFCQMFYWV